jgi:hypothetical protein
MSDTWDGGYEDSIDDGHEFAEKELLLPSDFFEEEGGVGLTAEDPHAKKLGGGVFEAMYDGTCAVCAEPIHAGDPITDKNVNGWRHAGCEGEQVFESQFKKDEKAAKDHFKKQARNF